MKIVVINQIPLMTTRLKKIFRSLSLQTNVEIESIFYSKLDKSLTNLIHNHHTEKIFVIVESSCSIDLIRLIRKKDITSPIIYLVTKHHSDYPELLIYKTLFINKYIMIKLSKTLLEIINICHPPCFLYHTLQQDLSISYDSITYINRDKEERKLIIHTDNDYYKVNLTLQDIQKYLDNRFKMSHRGCIINTQRVHCYDWHHKYIHLDSGELVPYLSKNFRDLLCEKIIEDNFDTKNNDLGQITEI